MEYLPTGTILWQCTRGYWKITGIQKSLGKEETYRVIKCTEQGKEFKLINGFYILSVHAEIKKGEHGLFKVVGQVKHGVKVSTDGKSKGINKRRINWLKSAIASYQKELEELEKEV